MLLPPPDPPAVWFARIVATLLAMLAARLERPGKPGLTGPVILAVAARLHRLGRRFARYAARWATGTLVAPQPRRTSVRRHAAARAGLRPPLPRGRAWLVRLVPGSGIAAPQLRALLDTPDMQAMLAAAPQIGRILRPFWHMISADPLPDALRLHRLMPSPEDPRPDPPPAPAGGRPRQAARNPSRRRPSPAHPPPRISAAPPRPPPFVGSATSRCRRAPLSFRFSNIEAQRSSLPAQ